MAVPLGHAGRRCCRPCWPAAHTFDCIALHDKWIVRKDGFSADVTRPWTVWRHNRTDTVFYAWNASATVQEAHAYVASLLTKYAALPEESSL